MHTDPPSTTNPPSTTPPPALTDEVRESVDRLEKNMAGVVLGKSDVVRLCVVALLAGEHVLLEDVPGVGKTLLAKALAKSVSGRFCRIQFTPDLLPSDITGSSVFDARSSQFVYHEGPIFANIVLADEINRTTPRTQSALLEAMSEAQVSADGHTYDLPHPFMVIATQNPFEYEGTYPLPESQLDRFLLRISIGYPSREDERQVLDSHRNGEPIDGLSPVLDGPQIIALQEAVRGVTVDDAVSTFLLDLIDATRACEQFQVGASTRGALCLYRACQALALVEGRDFVVPDDVKRLAPAVLAHRVIAKGYIHAEQRAAIETLIRQLVDELRVPS